MKSYKDIDKSILKAIKNPSTEAYENKIAIPELTFLGANDQPDFGRAYITFYAKDKVIELKSLKKYVFQLRDVHVSYERLVNVVYDHLKEVYDPERLRVVMEFYPRGGISSRMVVDSDWKARGGEEKYYMYDSNNEWQGLTR